MRQVHKIQLGELIMKKQLFLKLAVFSAFTAASLSAEEHVVIGHAEREFQEEIAIEHQQKKEEVRFKEEAKVEIRAPEEVEVVTSGSYHDDLNIGCYHNVTSKGANGEMFDIQDGSTWSVHHYDMYKVKQWREGDSILIGTSSYFFSSSLDKSSYRFEAYNRRSGSRVKVNLSQGPFPSKCRALERVNYDRVYLNDGTCWEVSGFDTGLLRKWKWAGKEGSERHSIILGINNTLDSAWNPYILINVDTNEYVRARQSYSY